MVGFTCLPANVWLPPVPTHPAGALTLVKVEVDFLSCPRFPQGHRSLCLWQRQIIELVLYIHLLYVLIRQDFSLWAEGQGDNLNAHLLWILKWKYWFPKGQWGCIVHTKLWKPVTAHHKNPFTDSSQAKRLPADNWMKLPQSHGMFYPLLSPHTEWRSWSASAPFLKSLPHPPLFSLFFVYHDTRAVRRLPFV